jgi:hypothetical protein
MQPGGSYHFILAKRNQNETHAICFVAASYHSVGIAGRIVLFYVARL